MSAPMNEFVLIPLDDCVALLEDCGFEIRAKCPEYPRAYRTRVRLDVVARLPTGEERIHRIIYLAFPSQNHAALLWESAERKDNPLLNQVEEALRSKFGPKPPPMKWPKGRIVPDG